MANVSLVKVESRQTWLNEAMFSWRPYQSIPLLIATELSPTDTQQFSTSKLEVESGSMPGIQKR